MTYYKSDITQWLERNSNHASNFLPPTVFAQEMLMYHNSGLCPERIGGIDEDYNFVKNKIVGKDAQRFITIAADWYENLQKINTQY